MVSARSATRGDRRASIRIKRTRSIRTCPICHPLESTNGDSHESPSNCRRSSVWAVSHRHVRVSAGGGGGASGPRGHSVELDHAPLVRARALRGVDCGAGGGSAHLVDLVAASQAGDRMSSKALMLSDGDELAEQSTPVLLSALARDVRALAREEVAYIRTELREDLERSRSALSVGAA